MRLQEEALMIFDDEEEFVSAPSLKIDFHIVYKYNQKMTFES